MNKNNTQSRRIKENKGKGVRKKRLFMINSY